MKEKQSKGFKGSTPAEVAEQVEQQFKDLSTQIEVSEKAHALYQAAPGTSLAGKKKYEEKLRKRGGGESKLRKVLVRLVVGLSMIAAFLGIIYAGHLYVCLLVAFLQVIIKFENGDDSKTCCITFKTCARTRTRTMI